MQKTLNKSKTSRVIRNSLTYPAAIALALLAQTAMAQATDAPNNPPRPTQAWMHSDVGAAWSSGYTGKGTSIHVVDTFSASGPQYRSNMLGANSPAIGTHGAWTATQAQMIAPDASVYVRDFSSNRSAVSLIPGQLNIVNTSYSLMAPSGYSLNRIGFSTMDKSIIDHAKAGRAVVVKSAGNNAVNVGSSTSAKTTDYLSLALADAPSAIIVGALNKNGTTTNKASLASYSNKAGTNVKLQNKFLTVGVDSSAIGLAGTSFAAPIVSGYAAILGSKFTTATPTKITSQLLATARTDTIHNYQPSVHGRGEASLSRALAPTALR